jgi:prepilin-type N-terminal cleavage/methylation domain-containing protein
MPNRLPTRASRGFTLLELMVALTVGGVAITSIYAIGASSTRAFHQQQQIATLQSSLRIALGQLKRDIARAGYLSTPSAGAGMSCAEPTPASLHEPKGNGSLAAIARFDEDFCLNSANGCSNIYGATSTTQNHNRDAGFRADSVVLMANYETAYEYPIFGKSLGAGGVVISQASHAYRTDFGTWHEGQPDGHDQEVFSEVFRAGRLVRVRTSKGFHHFATIGVGGAVAPTGTTQPEVLFAPAIPAACTGDVDSEAWVAPVSAIRYYARNDPNPPVATSTTVGPIAQFGPMAQLVREEVNPAAKAVVLPGGPPARVVLEYVVGFRLGFVMNSATLASQPDAFPAGIPDPNPVLALEDNPERVRAVRIDLAARTPEQDPRSPWSAATCANMRCFQVFDQRPGSARVRAVHAEVFIPNVALEGY